VAQGAAYLFTRVGVTWTRRTRLAPSPLDQMTFASFGLSVALDRKAVLIGAAQPSTGSNPAYRQGMAYLFHFDEATFSVTQEARFVPSDGRDNDRAGTSVALSGATVVIGAPRHDTSAQSDQGAAYVYATPGLPLINNYTKTGLAFLPNNHSGLAISGNLAVVGSAYASINNFTARGYVYVFARNDGFWQEEARLTPAEHTAEAFGFSVATNGQRIVIGSPSKQVGNNFQQGAAYVFGRDGSTWREERRLLAADGATDDNFGYSVAIDAAGQMILVGAPNDDHVNGTIQNQGSVYSYRLTTGWNDAGKIIPADNLAEARFGFDVALAQETRSVRPYWTALIGAPYATVNGALWRGAAYVFTNDSLSNWTQQTRLTPADGQARDTFGWSVALSRDTALIGAPGIERNDGTRAGVGAAYVFLRTDTAWSQQAKLSARDGVAEDFFWASVALDADQALIGAPYSLSSDKNKSGAAYLFSRNLTTWTQQQKFFQFPVTLSDFFGLAVALHESHALIAASLPNSSGILPLSSAFFYGHWSTLLSPMSNAFPASGGTGSVRVFPNPNTQNGPNAWTATSANDWVRIVSGGSGTGQSTFTYTVAPNPNAQPRTATINVLNASFVIQQAGSCATALNPARLPAAVTGQPYGQNLSLTTGLAINYRVINEGLLPPGLTLFSNGALLGLAA
jgi:hypothetical protein